LFKNAKIRRILYWVTLAVAGTVFLVAAFMIGKYYYDAQKNQQEYKELEQMIVAPPPAVEEEPEEFTPAQQYGSLYQQNNDFVGWIAVDGTRINYPVMQTVENPNYYLRRGFDKTYDYYGVPYAGEHCDLQTSDNVVLYGHHMNSGAMFSDLKKYLNKDFWNTQPYVRFDTMEEFGTYQVFAVFKISATDEFAYHLFSDAADRAEFDEYVAQCKNRSRYDTGITPVYGDRLLTLSTCEYSQTNGRLVVVAKKIA